MLKLLKSRFCGDCLRYWEPNVSPCQSIPENKNKEIVQFWQYFWRNSSSFLQMYSLVEKEDFCWHVTSPKGKLHPNTKSWNLQLTSSCPRAKIGSGSIYSFNFPTLSFKNNRCFFSPSPKAKTSVLSQDSTLVNFAGKFHIHKLMSKLKHTRHLWFHEILVG